jgi:hypothetical protein
MQHVADFITRVIIHDADAFNDYFRFSRFARQAPNLNSNPATGTCFGTSTSFQKVINSMQVVKARASRIPRDGSLGVLGVLPEHLNQKVFEEHVGIASLMKLRVSSRALCETVDGMPKYSTIARQASQSSQAMRTVRLASGLLAMTSGLRFLRKNALTAADLVVLSIYRLARESAIDAAWRQRPVDLWIS